jgi:hypothetical protein
MIYGPKSSSFQGIEQIRLILLRVRIPEILQVPDVKPKLLEFPLQPQDFALNRTFVYWYHKLADCCSIAAIRAWRLVTITLNSIISRWSRKILNHNSPIFATFLAIHAVARVHEVLITGPATETEQAPRLWRLAATGTGSLQHPVIALLDDPEQFDVFIHQIPLPCSCHPVEASRPARTGREVS